MTLTLSLRRPQGGLRRPCRAPSRSPFLLALAIVSGALLSASATPTASQQPRPGRHAYVFGLQGEFAKLDLDDLSVLARWALPQLEGFSEVLPPWIPPDSRRAQGVWGMSSLVYDAPARLFIGIVPELPRSQEDEVTDYRLLAFRLEPAELLAERSLVGLRTPPRLFLEPGERRLLLSYTASEPSSQPLPMIEVLDPDSLRATATLKEEAQSAPSSAPADQLFRAILSPQAHVDRDGEIVDGLYRWLLKDHGLTLQRQNPIAALTAEQRQALAGLETRDPASGKPWLKYGAVDSLGGRTLLLVGSDPPGKSAVFVLDLESGRVLSAFSVPRTSKGRIRLMSNGSRLLLQEVEWKDASPSQPEQGVPSGRYRIYDVETGKVLKTLDRPEFAVPGMRILCTSPSGDLALVGSAAEIRLLALGGVILPQAPPLRLPNGGSEGTFCVFADE
ncbi:MAG: hypothetical protein KDD47_22515 [Acidobacteria bacterium]|nr:hypothetical protein [Acidobacteriota bacterium]